MPATRTWLWSTPSAPSHTGTTPRLLRSRWPGRWRKARNSSIPGTTRPERLRENLAAAHLNLDPTDLELLDALPSAAGDRY